MSFIAELKRRNVVKVGIAYAIVAWVLTQIVIAVKAPLHLPDWVDTFFILLLVIGFPIAVIITWAFELTPEGVKRTEPTPDKPETMPVADGNKANNEQPSIAVLPFVNMSSDPEQEYFSDGLSEELLNQLAQIEDLRVIARTSSFAFKGRNADVREIGEQLGVAHVLEGSVRKSGDRLRITVQLIDTASGHHLWSETYDRQLDDVFAIQDEISHSVADALSITLGVGRNISEAERTGDVETYDLYLRARAKMHTFSPSDLSRGIDLFRQALARDPDYSRARAGLVHAATFAVIYAPDQRDEAIRVIKQIIAEADARSPNDWAIHLAHAMWHVYHNEWKDAEDAFARAEAHAPASTPEFIELKFSMLTSVGRIEDALEILQASMSGDPLSVNRSWQVQYALQILGRNEEAEAEYQRCFDLPGADAREDIHHWALFRVWNGSDAALIEKRFDFYLGHRTIPTTWPQQVRSVYNDPEAVLAVIRTAFNDPANQDPIRIQIIASYAGHYGDSELCLMALRRSLIEMGNGAVSQLWWPETAAARRLPGFKDLARELGLVDYWHTTDNWGHFCRPLGDNDFECE